MHGFLIILIKLRRLSKEKKQLSTNLVELNKQYQTQQDLIAELKIKLNESDQINTQKTSAYKFELAQAQQTAEDRAIASAKHQQEIQFLEQELQVLKNQTSQMAPAEQLAAVKSTLSEREKYYQNQLQLQIMRRYQSLIKSRNGMTLFYILNIQLIILL